MSSKTKHLVVVISGHGYGHAAMTAPLINAIQERHPQLRITLRSGVHLAFLQSKFKHPFDHLPDSTDFGMIMHDAFTVDKNKSLQLYQDFHQHWQARIDAEIALFKHLQADMLISNIAYLPLLAARQLGLPAVAYSCLNWAEIFQRLFPEQTQIYTQMLHAYRCADCIIRTEPGMPMTGLDTDCVGPIAELGQNRRQQLLDSLGLGNETRLILASMGGIKTDLRVANWPVLDGVHYLLPDASAMNRNDATSVSRADISFSDALCSCDVLFTKPGYGSFTEAAFNRKAVLYVERLDWPETPHLCDWLRQYTPCRGISQAQLNSGDFSSELNSLLQQTIAPDGPLSGLPAAIKLVEKHLQLNNSETPP